MARPPKHPVEFKLKIVMSALSGESAVADLARRHGVSETSISNWKQQFLQAGRQGLEAAARRGPSSREIELEREVQTLTQVVGELHVKLRVTSLVGPTAWGFADLEQMRGEISVSRFCELVGLPRRTYYDRRIAAGRDAAAPSSWPRPARQRISERGLFWARKYPQWGHRKVWAMIEPEHAATQSTTLRLLRDHELTLPIDDRAQIRELARVRHELFDQRFDRRNQEWQTDFTELETRHGGDWQMQPVVDYVTKLSLGCRVSTTQAAVDACTAIDDAISTATDILGRPLLDDLTCPDSGEITPVIIVSDNGPAFKSIRFERFVLARPELLHVRTRKRSPQTNGVVECFNRNIKYEDLFRDLPIDGIDLDARVAAYRTLYNTIRPHEGIDFARPHDRYTATITPPSTRQNVRIP